MTSLLLWMIRAKTRGWRSGSHASPLDQAGPGGLQSLEVRQFSLSLHPAMCDWPLLPAMAASLPRCLPPQGDTLGLASLTEALLPMAQPFPHHLASVQARTLGRIL